MTHYSIMPDYGGAYGWINRDGTDTLGPNHADRHSWEGDHPIAARLHRNFAAWQMTFETAQMRLDLDLVASLDWIRFHERGIELTRQLKTELGEAARVYYVKPHEDPNMWLDRRREVLADGSLIGQPTANQRPLRWLAWLPDRIVSGGQTGADRAALDWACGHRIVHGGWCPKGRRAADGPLAPFYQLQETESANYRQRTRLNVRDSDATLVLNVGELDGGTLQTTRFAQALQRPYRVFQLDHDETQTIAAQIVSWLSAGRYRTLNIAGPREERRPGSYARVMAVLDLCLRIGHGDP